MRFPFFVLLVVFSFFPVSASKAEEVLVRFEQVDQIPAVDLWYFATPEIVGSSSGATIGFWAYGPHEIRVVGEWSLIGVAMGGLGDEAEIPFAVNVWVKSGATFLHSESQLASEGQTVATAVFGFAPAECQLLDETQCADRRIEFAVQADGIVAVDGGPIGRVQ